MLSTTPIPLPSITPTGRNILIVTWLQILVALILVLLRTFYARRLEGHLRWDYIWVSVALVMGFACEVPLTIAVRFGLGTHMADLTYPQIFRVAKWVWITLIIGVQTAVWAKWSIIALLWQIQGRHARKRRYVLLVVGFFIAVWPVVIIALILTQCKPVAKLWNPTMSGVCRSTIPLENVVIFQGCVAALTDIILALWPISIVYDLQMPRRTKWKFCVLMAASMLPAVAAIKRTVLVTKTLNSADPTYDFGQFMIWSASETFPIFILGSIPPLQAWFTQIIQRTYFGRRIESNPDHGSDPTARDGSQKCTQSQKNAYLETTNELESDSKLQAIISKE